jgi:hypothetical protein
MRKSKGSVMMSEKTGGWIWANLEAERSVTTVTEEHLAAIRNLVAYWEPAETGAAGLADEDFLELYDAMEPEFEGALEVFMTSADLPQFKGKISNPYRDASEEQRALIEDVPDKDIRALLVSGEDIEFEASGEELALWREANRQASGINPKRPFGSENVSRDVRAIVDPEKTLSNAAFSKKRKHLESRLLLLLQYFVQNAKLEPGTWRRGEDWVWRLTDPDEPPPAEDLTRTEWVQRMYSQLFYEHREYHETLRCLAHLIWNNRLEGSYSELVRQFKLETHFDGSQSIYEGRSEDRLRAALTHFPEKITADDGQCWFTMMLVRLLNAQARFPEARDVLEKAGIFDMPAKTVDFGSINAMGLLFLEVIIVRRGLELLDDDEFQSILAGCHSRWRTESDLWRFVYDVQHDPDRIEDPKNLGLPHAQSVAVQLEVMRGGYEPDAEVRHY